MICIIIHVSYIKLAFKLKERKESLLLISNNDIY